jgi:hypothetical protein
VLEAVARVLVGPARGLHHSIEGHMVDDYDSAPCASSVLGSQLGSPCLNGQNSLLDRLLEPAS